MRIPSALRLALIALALLLSACGTDEAILTPTPTAASTSGSPGAADTSGLSAFEARLRDATTREGLLVRTIATATSGTAAELRLAIGQMRDWVDGERAWLAEHASDPCYDAAATKFSAALDAMSSSADWLEGTVEASLEPSDDVSRGSMGTEAANDLQDVARNLADAAAFAKTARPNCS